MVRSPRKASRAGVAGAAMAFNIGGPGERLAEMAAAAGDEDSQGGSVGAASFGAEY